MKTILITGGLGFIGSNFILYLSEKYPSYRLINLDKKTYAAEEKNLEENSSGSLYKYIQGDINNRELVEYIFREYSVSGVVHFAAESHVDNSIKDPSVFIQSNVLGTHTLIDVAYKYWMNGPFSYKKDTERNRFLHISTDEVYGSMEGEESFTETSPYAPNNPYSASKASSDMIIRSYFKTYGLDTVITNSSNNYGPRQHDEKLIPTIIRNALNGSPIPIYGDGKNVRDWLFVKDHCRGIDIVFHMGRPGEIYNISGDKERENNLVVKEICSILDEIHQRNDRVSYKDQITYVEDRPGHDRRYSINAGKIKSELGWQPVQDFRKGLKLTVEWYLEKYT